MSEERIEYESDPIADREKAIRDDLLSRVEIALRVLHQHEMKDSGSDDEEYNRALLNAAQLFQAYSMSRLVMKLDELAETLEDIAVRGIG